MARARPGPKKTGSGSARARKNRLDTALVKAIEEVIAISSTTIYDKSKDVIALLGKPMT